MSFKVKIIFGISQRAPGKSQWFIHLSYKKRDARNILGYFDILYTPELAHHYIRNSWELSNEKIILYRLNVIHIKFSEIVHRAK